MTELKKSPRKGHSGWLKPLLFVSLAANLLIVGMVGGAMMRHDTDRWMADKRPAPLRDLGYSPFGFALSSDDRAKIGQAMTDRSPDLRANREEVRQQFSTLLELLRSTPFEMEAVREIVEVQQLKLNERQQIGQEVLLERIGSMSDRERADFAKRLERSLHRSFRRKK